MIYGIGYESGLRLQTAAQPGRIVFRTYADAAQHCAAHYGKGAQIVGVLAEWHDTTPAPHGAGYLAVEAQIVRLDCQTKPQRAPEHTRAHWVRLGLLRALNRILALLRRLLGLLF